MAEGFLGRWAQRKTEARQGLPLAEPTPAVDPPAVVPPASVQAEFEATEPAPLPTLQDAQALTAESDFKPFMARGVLPEVKNAAMKKLFTDPHYNVMDRLDIYIDDYSKSDPIPESMLRQMVSAKFLKLFEDEDEDEDEDEEKDAASAAPVAGHPAAVTPSPSPSPREADAQTAVHLPSEPTHHDDPHLRLQSDHAAPAQSPGRGTE